MSTTFMAWKEEDILQTSTSGVVLEGKEEFQWGSVMVNFTGQLDQSMGFPGIWLNITLGMTVRVILDEINIWISRLNEADCPSPWEWASCNPSKPQEKERLTQGIFADFFFST